MVRFIKKYLFALATGLLLGLSLLDHFEFLVLVALVPLFLSWVKPSQPLKYYFFSGFLAQLCYTGAAFFWIQNAGKTYFLLNSFTAFLFYMFFIGLFSLQWGLIGILFGWIQQRSTKYLVFTLPFFFILIDELVFRFFPFHFGFHWYAARLPGLNWASAIGLSGLGFLVLVINMLFMLFVIRKYVKVSSLGLLSIGLFLALSPKPKVSDTNIRVLGVQGFIPNDIKRTDLQVVSNQMMTVDRYYSLTRLGLNKNGELPVDLIVWPETALPFIWKRPGENIQSDSLQNDALSFAKRIKIPILTGGYYEDEGTYNSVVLMDSDLGFTHSEKHYLFPIGEVIPFNDFGGLTKDLFPEVPRFKSKKMPSILKVKGYSAVVPICYEALFSEFFESFSEPIEWIVSLSNDSWFESDLQKKWHALMSLSRSVEYQVPVLRVTNDGVSGAASSDGRYTFFKALQEGSFDTQIFVTKKFEKSWMQKNGDVVNRLPRFISYILILLLIGARIKRRRY